MICNFLLCFRALGIPATDYVMEGRNPVRKLGGLSLPLDSPARETLTLLRKNRWEFASWLVSQLHLPPFFFMVFSSFSLGAADVESALWRMIDRCRSGSVKACVKDLASILGLTDKRAAVTICSLYSKVEFSLFLLSICVHIAVFVSHFLFPSRMKVWTSDVSISALQPCQDLLPSDHFFTQLLL